LRQSHLVVSNMSAKRQNTQFLLMGLAAVAAAGVLYYLVQEASSGTVKAKKLSDLDDLADDDTVQAKGGTTESSTAKSTTSKDISASSTSSEQGPMDEKDLHAKIEELDKKGKAFFKNKQVGFSNVRCMNPQHSPQLTLCGLPFVSVRLVFGGRLGVYRGSHHD
jgi:hypothetical protein